MLCLKSKFFYHVLKISDLISHQDLVFIIYLACVQSQGKLVAWSSVALELWQKSRDSRRILAQQVEGLLRPNKGLVSMILLTCISKIKRP